MKKIVSLILVVVLCLAMCACGEPKTVEEAVEKAESIMEKWDKKTKNLAHYETEYFGELGLVVKVTALTTDDMSEDSRLATGKAHATTVFNELYPILEDFNVDLTVTVYPEHGNIPIYVELNGSPI